MPTGALYIMMRSKSLQHYKCNSGQLRATHATTNQMQQSNKNGVEVARNVTIYIEHWLKSSLQMSTGSYAPTQLHVTLQTNQPILLLPAHYTGWTHRSPQGALFDCWLLMTRCSLEKPPFGKSFAFQTTAPRSLLRPCFLVCCWGPSHLYHLRYHPWRKVSFLNIYIFGDIALFLGQTFCSSKNYIFFRLSFGWVSKS